jgi:hypothetical protein
MDTENARRQRHLEPVEFPVDQKHGNPRESGW